MDYEIAFAIDAEVSGPPVFYAVGLKCLFDGRGQLLALSPPSISVFAANFPEVTPLESELLLKSSG